jgi:hypothetical protein
VPNGLEVLLDGLKYEKQTIRKQACFWLVPFCQSNPAYRPQVIDALMKACEDDYSLKAIEKIQAM